MPEYKYSVVGLDPDRTVKGSSRELRISPKAASELCSVLKGMKIDDAMSFLERVKEKKQPVPFKRYKKKASHKRGVEKWCAARYPVKAANAILKILENIDTIALQKGLDPEKLKVIHASALKARKIRKYIPRAFGRSTPYFDQLCHVELVVGEE
jgi:large subunit ribosomal protein L22